MSWRRFLRELHVLLGLRRITPARGGRRPRALVHVPELDTGGAYRPAWRPQDPSVDPREPYGGESSSRGSDHGWSGCTCSSAAVALAYHTHGDLELWGGDMRHAQSDLEGGTDLYDMQDAWAEYGQKLTIRSGAGWSAVREAHDEQRAIVIQGTGEVPGNGSFDGGHACCIGIETHADGRWLWGDPLCTGWQWIDPGAIRTWAERWQSSIAFAESGRVSSPAPEPPPEPEPEPCDCTPELAEQAAQLQRDCEDAAVAAGDALVGVWVEWLRAPAPAAADYWDAGSWAGDAELATIARMIADECDPDLPASWHRGRVPYPVADALAVVGRPAAWDASAWRAAGWAA